MRSGRTLRQDGSGQEAGATMAGDAGAQEKRREQKGYSFRRKLHDAFLIRFWQSKMDTHLQGRAREPVDIERPFLAEPSRLAA